MKALVAAACIAVIAVAGYFFIGEYSDHRTRVATEKRLADIRLKKTVCAGADDMRLTDKTRSTFDDWCREMEAQ